ncbi:hypothetical protein FPZ11_11485 [Humibacter ginsenosidimutans]|uniref:Uncharacterized protein n=1 Tax=Humibacter ginsenosidimutans TaxID=2599293 RepID=A0A5B8M8T3_9MICO|nr:hypothetical protein FPZ11_11485 [Humibacter ginsenosidimutans]
MLPTAEHAATTLDAEATARLADVATDPAWLELKAAATSIQADQIKDGSIPDAARHADARAHVDTIVASIRDLTPLFPHDADYLETLQRDFARWADDGFGVPDFYDSLVAFQPQQHRVDGLRHLVVFPMYTQNGSTDRHIEALIVETIWPEFVAELERTDYGNKLFVSLRLIDFTSGYDTNSAVLFPETVAMRELPTFTWGAIFQDREAARYRVVVRAASDITKLDLPEDAARLLDDQNLIEETFVMWDIIHDRTHMRGDLPFDPFMIKQRMPYFLYSLEELRCDLTAYREAFRLEKTLGALPTEELSDDQRSILEHASLVRYAILFDRIFRFPITGTRVRNYDGLGGQLLFAWLHQHHVLDWTDTQLSIDWDAIGDAVVALSDAINELYWRSIDRPKTAHWLAAYELVSGVLAPNPASVWAKGLPEEVLAGAPKGYTDAVLDDEFPLSMFYEALNKKMGDTIESTKGITATSLG